MPVFPRPAATRRLSLTPIVASRVTGRHGGSIALARFVIRNTPAAAPRQAIIPIVRQGRSPRIVTKAWTPTLLGRRFQPPIPPSVRPTRRRGDEQARSHPGRIWQAVWIQLPVDSGDWYDVYGSPAADQPIAYDGPPLIRTQATSWTTGLLSAPGAWGFGTRAANSYGEEQNLDCSVTIVLDSLGNDITNRPSPPVGLRAFATPAGGIRVEWHYPPSRGVKAPTGFHVYIGTGGTPNYSTSVATAPIDEVILNSFVADLCGLTDGTTYTIGVRAYNASGEEGNTSMVSVTADTSGPSPVAGLSANTIV
jgi:hypothetical protein